LSPSPLTFAHIQQSVDQIVTVSEAAIRAAVRSLALDAKLVIEPSGALGLAAWQSDTVDRLPNTVLVLSGGSIDPATLAALIQP
jgi:threonine dehydratase